jgi:hypothetical protein
MTKGIVAILAAFAFTSIAAVGHAQSIFLDVNGDGRCGIEDVLDATVTSVDVYIDTNHDLTGREVTCPDGEPLAIFSYTFILRWTPIDGGKLTYGEWTDNLGFPGFAGGRRAGADMWLGRMATSQLPPGKYKLGVLNVSVEGTGILQILSSDPGLDPTAITSFGSPCEGGDFDDTIKLGSDFLDSCGTTWEPDRDRTTWAKIEATYR